ncbi:MAG: OmpA family protein [Pseudomonadota bacterium]
MSSDDIQEETTHRRLVRWQDNYDTPLWPIMLAALLLFLLLIFAAAGVQARTQLAADRALDEVDAVWARARASGRQVRLIGSPPNERAAQQAYNAVQNAEASTWFFSGRQPMDVIRDFDTDEMFGIAAADRADASPPDWRFRRSGGTITLAGEVPDRETKAAINEVARLSLGSSGILSVIDNLATTGESAPPDHMGIALRALAILRSCETAEIVFERGVFSVDCEAERARIDTIRERAEADLAYGEIGTIDIDVASSTQDPIVIEPTEENIAACDDIMADLLGQTRILFETNSDRIDPSNSNLLDRIADAAETCPGTLQISGHTDNRGSDIINETLSQQRASAVRRALIRRGVPPGRLVAEGFGSRVPISSNFTEAGRARNRRIEIKVLQ